LKKILKAKVSVYGNCGTVIMYVSYAYKISCDLPLFKPLLTVSAIEEQPADAIQPDEKQPGETIQLESAGSQNKNEGEKTKEATAPVPPANVGESFPPWSNSASLVSSPNKGKTINIDEISDSSSSDKSEFKTEKEKRNEKSE
jgi:hypothetical protein